ncbi:MAG: hypothetical protein IPH06_03645 [Alphaproteobacteria bacterium]|nr:hypothetical protein [Alphaproteobacteria bacterium]QQS57138.1 MAG: hypothetical protein IPN28_12955 [Alphaproteobacteria bacterium]
MNSKNKSRLKNFLETAAKLSYPETEYSKPINFSLDYASKHGKFFDPLFKQISEEIEEQESRNRRAEDVKKRFEYAVRILILNMMQARTLMKGNLYLCIPLNRNNFNLGNRYTPKEVTFNPFKDAVNGLIESGYLTIHRKGFHDTEGFNGPLQTQISPTEKLIYQFESFKKEFSYIKSNKAKDETIILKAPDKKKQDYKDNSFTNRARKNLDLINNTLAKHDLKINVTNSEKAQLESSLISRHIKDHETQPFIDFTAKKLYRIFSDGSFKRGGRFYRGWWQNVPKEFRKFITINDKGTIELDYTSLHPSILYAKEQLPLKGDAYKIHPKVARRFGKQAFNALLNAKGKPKKPSDFNEDEVGINWSNFQKMMMEKHQALTDRDYFMKGYGLNIQFLDSQLTEKVLIYFANKNIPCLPIHDSFIVCKDNELELSNIMKKTYKDLFQSDIQIRKKG